MKKLAYIIVASIVMSACNSGFLEISPISTVDIDAVYTTDKDYQDAVVGIYRAFADQYQNFWQFGDLRGDDSEAQMYKGTATDFMNDFTLDNSAGILQNSWANYYTMINRANMVLERIESADPAVVTNKNRHIGEAKFLRALAYFDLVRIFGDVPLITKVITEEESYQIGRSSVDEVYNGLIISDLLDAENLLANRYTGVDVGRATSGAAKALLGKVYLTRHDFVNAEAKLAEVTTLGYALLDNFNDLFDYSSEHHSEYIFDAEYEEGMNMGSIFTNNFCPNVPFISDHFGVNGVRSDNQNPTDALFEIFVDEDLRKDITVARGITDENGNFIPLPSQQVRSFTKKYMTPVATTNDSKANWKVIRYADVLLMLAEAMNENGKTDEALDYLNQVRERAGLEGYADLSPDDAREKIYTERRLELAFEGHRWFDLVRTGSAYRTMAAYGMEPHMTIFPIPLVQLQVVNNPQILPQNPGYE
ncbi:RagB/SusD family nutrient uptake outer membrane protein [Parapedobacter koreensis]|uniref:Starch-binding associating with outer membrane n=1 Tax=Parapedobacter koreensis TaxID=332977 RepID=A0A1H7UJT2_9SPHI|nr:RagB/SusD family nutrient uptake outer membrane protein [Parapedobacter koreensis]SEL97320.1 Starch-binding associating with outer membrane [Parapedobacter koreensis]